MRQHRFLLEAAREGLDASITDIARRAGVCRWSFYSWQRKSGAFREAWSRLPEEILSRQLPRVIAAMIERAVRGSDVAGAAILRHGLGDRIEHRGRIEHAVTHTLDLSRLGDEELVTLEQILSRARAGETVEERVPRALAAAREKQIAAHREVEVVSATTATPKEEERERENVRGGGS